MIEIRIYWHLIPGLGQKQEMDLAIVQSARGGRGRAPNSQPKRLLEDTRLLKRILN